MVVLGSKMVVPSSVTGHGALPSANTSPEIRLLGFPSSVTGHGALPSANTSPEIRLLAITQCPCVEITQSLRAAGAGRRAVAPTQTPLVSTHPPKIAIPLLGGTKEQESLGHEGGNRDQCNMPLRAASSRVPKGPHGPPWGIFAT